MVNADGTFKVDPGRIKEGVAGLTRDIMTIQAEGDYAKAKALGERMGVVRPEVQKVLDRLASIPVDIEPQVQNGGSAAERGEIITSLLSFLRLSETDEICHPSAQVDRSGAQPHARPKITLPQRCRGRRAPT